MDWLLHNAIADMNGPRFLVLYGGVIAAALITCAEASCWRWRITRRGLGAGFRPNSGRRGCCRYFPAVLLWLALGAASLPAAAAGEWPGWRGVAQEGHSADSRGPVHWSPTRNVIWKTAIPGEGHSSPIVSSDAAYVTVARRAEANPRLLVALQSLLWIALLLVAASATAFLARQCAAAEGGRRASVTRLAGLGLLVTALCGLVVYGEALLDFNRAVERGWIAACLCGMLCMVVSTLLSPPDSRAALLGGLSLLAFSALLYVTIPDRPHTIDADPFSEVSVLIYVVIALPALTGAALLARCLPNPRRPDASLPKRVVPPPRSPITLAARGLVALLSVSMLAVLVKLAAAQRQATETTVSVGTAYEPMLPWWAVLVPAGGLTLFWLTRRKAGEVWWSILGMVASAVLLGVFGLLALVEQAVTRVPYLAYLLGTPRVTPMLGWPAVVLLAVVCALALLHGLRPAVDGRQARLTGPPGILRGAAYGLTFLYFVYANYVPKSPRLERAIVSVERRTGDIRWISGGLIAPRGIMHSDNSPAAPTPVTDGERVYAYFGTPGLMAVDVRGRRHWINGQLPFESREGVASSPVLCRGKVIVLSESDAGNYLAAVDGSTGKLVWRTERSKKTHSFAGNCRTPCIMAIGGREVILVWGYEDLSGYDPVTGRELWSHAIGDLGAGGNPVASAVSDERNLFLVGPSETICLDKGKLAGPDTPIRWREYADDGAQCASPVVKNGLLFAVSDNGTAYCLETRTGKLLWIQDLEQQHYASVTAIGDRIYFCDSRGRTTVVACDRTYRVLSRNDLGEQTYASFAPVDSDLFIRTQNHLYCLREW